MWNDYDCDDDDDDPNGNNGDDITEASSIGWGTFRRIAENARRMIELDGDDPAGDEEEEKDDDDDVAIPPPPPIILRGDKEDDDCNFNSQQTSAAAKINRSGGVILGSTSDPVVLSRAREIIRQRGEERVLQPSSHQGRRKIDGSATMSHRLSSTSSQRPFNPSMRNQLHSSNSNSRMMPLLSSGRSSGSVATMTTNGSVLTDEMTEFELKRKIRRLQQQLLIKQGGFQLGKLVENIQKGGSIMLPTDDDHDYSHRAQQMSGTTNNEQQRQIQQKFKDRSQLHLHRLHQNQHQQRQSLDTIGEDDVDNDHLANPITRSISSTAISGDEFGSSSRDMITSSMQMQSVVVASIGATVKKQREQLLSNHFQHQRLQQTMTKQAEILQLPPIHTCNMNNRRCPPRFFSITSPQSPSSPLSVTSSSYIATPERGQTILTHSRSQVPSMPTNSNRVNSPAAPFDDETMRTPHVSPSPTRSDHSADNDAGKGGRGVASSHRRRQIDPPPSIPLISIATSSPRSSVVTSSPRSVAQGNVLQNDRIVMGEEEDDDEEEEEEEAFSTNSDLFATSCANDHSAASAHVDTLSSSSGSRSAEEKDQTARERLKLMKEESSSIRSSSTSSTFPKGPSFGVGDATSCPTKEEYKRSLAAHLPTMINLQSLSRLQQQQQHRSSSAMMITMIDKSKSFESRKSLFSAQSFEHGVQPAQSFANSIQPSVESECVRQNATLFDIMSEDNKVFFVSSAATGLDGPKMSFGSEADVFEDVWLRSAANVLNPLVEDEENTSSSEEHEVPQDCNQLHYDCDDSQTNSTCSSDTEMQSQPPSEQQEDEEEEEQQQQQQDTKKYQSGGADSLLLSTYLNLITSSPSHEYDDPSIFGMNSLITEESSIFSNLPAAPNRALPLSEQSSTFSDLPSVATRALPLIKSVQQEHRPAMVAPAQVTSRMTAAPQTKNVGAPTIASQNNLATFLNKFSNGLLRGCTQLGDNESSVVFSINGNFELADDGLLESNTLTTNAAATSYPSIHNAPTNIQSNKCEKGHKFCRLNTQQAKTSTPSDGYSSNAVYLNTTPNLPQPLTAKERERNRKQDTTPLRSNASPARSTIENIAPDGTTTMTSSNVVQMKELAELGRIVESKEIVRFYDKIKLTRECDEIRPNIVQARAIVSKDSRDDDDIDSPDSSLLAGISEADQYHQQGDEACLDSQAAADDMKCYDDLLNDRSGEESTLSAQFTENIKMTSRELYKGRSFAWHSSNGVNYDEQYNSKQWSSLRADRAAQLVGKLSLFSLSRHAAQLQEHFINDDATSRDSASPLYQSTFTGASGSKNDDIFDDVESVARYSDEDGCRQDEDEKSIGYTHDDFVRDFHTILDNGRNVTLGGSANDYTGRSHHHCTSSSSESDSRVAYQENDYLPSSLRKVTLPGVDTRDGFDSSRKSHCRISMHHSRLLPNKISKSLLEEKLRGLSGGAANSNQGDNSVGTSDLGSLYTKASERSQSILPVPSTIFHRTFPNSSARSSPSSIANTYNGELFMARSLLSVAKESFDTYFDDDNESTKHNELNPSKLFESTEYNDDGMPHGDSRMRQVQESTTYEYENSNWGNEESSSVDVWPKNITSQVTSFFSAIHLVDSDQEQSLQLRSNPTMDSTVLAENKMAERPPLHKSGKGEFVLHQVKSKASIIKAEKLRDDVLTRDSSEAADHIPEAVLSSRSQSLGQSSFTAANHKITARPRSLLSDMAMLQVENADVILSHQHKKREEVEIASKQLDKTSTADRQNPSSTMNQLQTPNSLNSYIQSSRRVADEASLQEAFEVAPLRSFAHIGKISKHNVNKASLNDLGVHHAFVKRGYGPNVRSSVDDAMSGTGVPCSKQSTMDVVASQQHASTKGNPKPTTISVTPMNNADIHKRPPLVTNTEINKDQTQVKNGRRKTARQEVMKDRIRLRWKKLVGAGGEGAPTPWLTTHTKRK